MSSENEMTVLELDDADNIVLDNYLYLLQGDGVDRDRKMTLQQLRDFIQLKLTTVYMTEAVVSATGASADIKGASIKMGNSSGASGVFEADNIHFTVSGVNASYGVSEASVGNVKLNSDGVTVSGDGGASNLDNDELTFSSSVSNTTTYNAFGMSVTYNGVVVSVANKGADDVGFGVSGSGGGSSMKQEGFAVSSGTASAKMTASGVNITSGSDYTNFGATGIATNGSLQADHGNVNNAFTAGSVNATKTVSAAKLQARTEGLVLPVFDSDDDLPLSPSNGQIVLFKTTTSGITVFQLRFYDADTSTWKYIG